jgi:hypothetical protein
MPGWLIGHGKASVTTARFCIFQCTGDACAAESIFEKGAGKS